jgi:hypothetical protein
MLLDHYIKKRAKELGLPYMEAEPILREAVKLPFIDNTKIDFSLFLAGDLRQLNAISMWRGLILASAEWAARLVLEPGEEVRNAFIFTMGHEMTHQKKDYFFLGFPTSDKCFVNWVSEAYADFGGAMLAFDGKIEPSIFAMEYKRRNAKNNKDTISHPSWERRIRLVSSGSFDTELIHLIASDTGCKNEKLINALCRFYDPIKLKD